MPSGGLEPPPHQVRSLVLFPISPRRHGRYRSARRQGLEPYSTYGLPNRVARPEGLEPPLQGLEDPLLSSWMKDAIGVVYRI